MTLSCKDLKQIFINLLQSLPKDITVKEALVFVDELPDSMLLDAEKEGTPGPHPGACSADSGDPAGSRVC